MDQTIWNYILQPEQKVKWGHIQTQSRHCSLVSFVLTVALNFGTDSISILTIKNLTRNPDNV